HAVAAGEQRVVPGLVRQPAVATDFDPAVGLRLYAQRLQPLRRARAEAEGDDDDIRLDHRFAAGDRLRRATTVGIGFAQPRFHHPHAAGLAVADDLQRLAVEQELHAFLARIRHLARGAGHVGLVAAVRAGDAGRAETDRRTHAVHAGVAAAEHDHRSEE